MLQNHVIMLCFDARIISLLYSTKQVIMLHNSPLRSHVRNILQRTKRSAIVLALAQARLALSWANPKKYRHCASELTDPASPASFSSLETVVNVADARLPVVPGPCSTIFTRSRGNCACASCVRGKFTNNNNYYYASIMLVAFEDQYYAQNYA